MLNQKLKLKLSQKLSPQQIQLMKLIQLSTLEFEEKIKNEIEENPALERGVEELEDHNKGNDENSTEDKFEENEIDVDSYLSEDDFPSYDLGYYNSNETTNKEIPSSGGISFHQFLYIPDFQKNIVHVFLSSYHFFSSYSHTRILFSNL